MVRISVAEQGRLLLDLLARRFTYHDRAAWQRELAAGRLLVNNAPATAEQPLAAGDQLVYLLPELVEPPVVLDYRVVHEDDDLLVIDKPAPLPCHPGGRYFRHTLWALLKERQGLAEPAFVHRLDRETSGLVVVARHKAAARHLADQFAARQVEKEYLVIVEGECPLSEFSGVGWLAPDAASAVRKKMRVYPDSAAAPAGAKTCITDFTRLSGNHGLTLLAARPHTGRGHQIRATLLGLGWPVAGDKLYGVDENFFLRFKADQLTADDRARLRLPRQALHAARLKIIQPLSGKALEFAAPLPPDLAALLAGSGNGSEPPDEP